jgi:acid phosphatase family membrane protein YuiD
MMDDIHEGKRIGENRLKELVGHTPVEVFVGGLIGVLVSFVFYN